MNPVQLLSHFDRISDAPDAIPRLRQFILELAVRGKLVDRDPRDEPVAELLKRIQAAKEKRIKEEQVKKQEPLLQVRPSEAWFDLPASWCWVRLGTITQIIMGQSPLGETYNKTGEGIPLINGPVEFTEGPFGKTVSNQYTTAPTNLCEEGDLLLCVRGSTTGRTNIAGFRACIGRGVAAIRPFFADQYVRLFIWRLRASIIAMGRGIAFPSVSRQQIEELPVPLPPLAEQHRIVVKVDELMSLCDRLEVAQAERESRRDRLVASSLNRLNNGAEADSFREHARFYFNHLPRLTTRHEHVQQLRQTILNLAVRGKLVPQEPKEEPAEELAEPPAKKSAPQKGDRDAPFELPATWQWMQLGQVSELINGDRSKNYPNKAEYVREGVAWINTGHIEPDGTLSTDSMHYITRKKFDSLRSGKVRPGDLIYCLRGATLGKTAIITQFDEGAVASSLVIVRLSLSVDPRFAYQVLTSPLGCEQIFQFDNGSAQPNLSANNVKKYWIPIPPLAEQHRIVAKVDELMALCDRLEAQLTTTQTESRRLLEAVLHEALTPALEKIA